MEYEVEKILDHRFRHRRLEYLVKWVGYPEHDASWEPEGNLQNAQDSIAIYRASRTMPEGGGSDVMVLQSATFKEPHRDITNLPEPQINVPQTDARLSDPPHSQHMSCHEDNGTSKMPPEHSTRFRDIPVSSNID
jgi:hypothetical protein